MGFEQVLQQIEFACVSKWVNLLTTHVEVGSFSTIKPQISSMEDVTTACTHRIAMECQPQLSVGWRGILGACSGSSGSHVEQQQYSPCRPIWPEQPWRDRSWAGDYLGLWLLRLRAADESTDSPYSALRSLRDRCEPAESPNSRMTH